MSYKSAKDKWETTRTYSMTCHEGTFEAQTSADELTGKLTLTNGKNQASVVMNADEWESMGELRWQVHVKQPEEKVLDTMANGEKVQVEGE